MTGAGARSRSPTPVGRTARYTYVVFGRMTATAVSLAGTVTAHDAEGRRTAWTLGSPPAIATLPASAAYDAADKLESQSAPGVAASHSYDSATSRKTTETVAVTGSAPVTSTFAYTGSGRLSRARIGATTWDYAFDARGNLTRVVTGGVTTTFTATADNDRLTSSVTGGVTTTYRNDALGRRTSSVTGSVTTAYTYDGASRLTGWGRGASSAAYAYDALGQRTRAVLTEGGLTTTSAYAYDNITLLSLAAARSDGATWTVAYLTGEDGRPYAGVYTAGASSPVTFLIATTDPGDVVALTNTAGAPFARYTYDPYGRVLSQTANAVTGVTSAVASAILTRQPLRYAGYTYDAHSQTYYLSQRHYDPATARFLTKDPARDDGEESAYQYCGGDPVGKVDPTGEAPYAAALPVAVSIPGVGWVAIGAVVAVVGVGAIVKYGVPWAIERYTWARYGKRIEGLIRTASTHVAKLNSAKGSDPNGYNRNRNKWKGEAKTALKEARRLAEKHLRGKTRNRILQRIKSVEGQVNKH